MTMAWTSLHNNKEVQRSWRGATIRQRDVIRAEDRQRFGHKGMIAIEATPDIGNRCLWAECRKGQRLRPDDLHLYALRPFRPFLWKRLRCGALFCA